jgi:hypothetical protein
VTLVCRPWPGRWRFQSVAERPVVNMFALAGEPPVGHGPDEALTGGEPAGFAQLRRLT